MQPCVKDDHMPAETDTRRNLWLPSVLFGALSLSLVYVPGFGPVVRITGLNPGPSDLPVEWPEPSAMAVISEDSDESHSFFSNPEFKLTFRKS
jgi:hypothetical protein